MTKFTKIIVALLFCSYSLAAQDVILMPTAKFKTGDNAEWKNRQFNDLDWKSIGTLVKWEKQGYDKYNGFAWYRFHLVLPSSLKDKMFWNDSLSVSVAKVDDVDETFFNGTKIGQTGSLPTDQNGYEGKYAIDRLYRIPLNSNLIKWDEDNVVAVRVFDDHDGGGIYSGVPFVKIMEPLDAVQLTINVSPSNKDTYIVTLAEVLKKSIKGTLSIDVKDAAANKIIYSTQNAVELGAAEQLKKSINLPTNRLEITASFKESISKRVLVTKIISSYILTPEVSAKPRINGVLAIGTKIGKPFLYRIPVTGVRPLNFDAKSLPKGLKIDLSTGIISGVLKDSGNYAITVVAINKFGKDQKILTIKAGNTLAITPPMGWNSWYCYGLNVTEENVRASVKVLQKSGLVDHGWNYINIDDGWNAERVADGAIEPNKKFKDMKALGDWIHANGLYYGIYTSPGVRTCGGYPGSYGHEFQDAETFANWGVDYLKYDWCSYSEVVNEDTTLVAFQKPYALMDRALKLQKRAIVYSLCQYGMKDVWKWGEQIGGNCWRTGHDVRDTWESISAMVDKEADLYSYAKPGSWNDPDILVIGVIGGYKNESKPSQLNPDEQYSHISLWSMLAAPLLIGCDLNKLDAFTLNLLSNDEVISVNQDVLGRQAERKLRTPFYDVWVKAMSDGSTAIAIVNTSNDYKRLTLRWSDFLPVSEVAQVRDLWRQKNLRATGQTFQTEVPAHGTTLLKVWKKK